MTVIFCYFIDTVFHKFDRYKHVQSANIAWDMLLFLSESFTRYSSNKTNALQEIRAPSTLAFSCEVVHEKLWKSVYICKSYNEQITSTFFYMDTVYKQVCNHYFRMPVTTQIDGTIRECC